MARVGVTLTAILSGAALLAGCPQSAPSDSGSASTPSSVVSPTAAAATSRATSAGTAAAGGTTPPAVDTSAAQASSSTSGPGLCTPTVARFSITQAAGGDNHSGFLVHVVNASSSPCVTTGYPGVALLDSSGQQVEQAQRTPSGYLGGLASGTSAARIVLAPSDEATALVEGVNGNATGPACVTSPALLFTLPDNTDSTTLRHSTPACAGLQVHPLVQGDSGAVGH